MRRSNKSEFNKLSSEYKMLSHTANERLRALEKYAKRSGFHNILNWAYKKAMRSIRYWRGEGRDRFSEAVPKNQKITTLRARLSDVKRFLGMPSSTMTGIKQTYESRANTLNAKFGTTFTWENMGIFFESKVGQTMATREGGSPKVLMAIAELQKNEKDIIDALKNGNQVNLKIDDPIVEKIAHELLNEYGLDFTKLYRS